MDYAYTLQGWLKGMNNDILNPQRDMGNDALTSSSTNYNRYVAQDVFGFSLGYYENDYKKIGSAPDFLASTGGSALLQSRRNLYNGNISHMVSSHRNIGDVNTKAILGYAYQYDQLNRIGLMSAYNNINESTNSWGGKTIMAYSSSYTYDRNGNLLELIRKRGFSLFDNLSYYYFSNSNRLESVNDAAATNLEINDIDGQAGPYEYDYIGNLISDPSEHISSISWTSTGKLKKIERTPASTRPELQLSYNTSDIRAVKSVKNLSVNNGNNPLYDKNYYICDAQGNIMAIYASTYENINEGESNLRMTFALIETPVYGSSRVAVVDEYRELVTENYRAVYTPNFQSTLVSINITELPEIKELNNGYKMFELTNHLGNVMAVVSDKRTPVANRSLIQYFNPELCATKEYYPFGMELVGFGDQVDDYRWGFQGQEKIDEISGEGNYIDFKYRGYNPRIGRFFAIDPLASQYAYNSTYAFAENRVIDGIEFEGLERVPSNEIWPYEDVEGLSLGIADFNNWTKAGGYVLYKYTSGHNEGNFLVREFYGRNEEGYNIYQDLYIAGYESIDNIKSGDFEIGGTGYNVMINARWLGGINYNDSPKEKFYKVAKQVYSPENIIFGIGGGLLSYSSFVTISSKPTISNIPKGGYQNLKLTATNLKPRYLYHYTNKVAAQNISSVGLQTKYSSDGFIYLTNKGNLSPLQAQIELALPANRALPNSLLKIDTKTFSPSIIRRVQGNLPRMGAGGGTEFLFNQNIPADAVKIVK